jgi:mono/diheme cytochrome c family protein
MIELDVVGRASLAAVAAKREGGSRTSPQRGVVLAGAILCVSVACLSIAALAGQSPAAIKNPIAATPESIAAGKQIYTRSCAPCHGISGQGGPGNDLIPAAPDLTDAAWDHGSTDGEIFVAIKDGIGPEFNMTPFKDRLKDEEIWNVVNYVRSLKK